MGNNEKLDAIFKFNLLLFSFFWKGRPPSLAGENTGTHKKLKTLQRTEELIQKASKRIGMKIFTWKDPWFSRTAILFMRLLGAEDIKDLNLLFIFVNSGGFNSFVHLNNMLNPTIPLISFLQPPYLKISCLTLEVFFLKNFITERS